MCLSLFSVFAADLPATEIIAKKSDTFVFEGMPSEEFSKSDFLATAYVKGERAIAYITFDIDAGAVGIDPETDTIMTATLTLFVKKVPLMPDSNAAAGKKEENKDENKEESPLPDPAETAVKTAQYSVEKIESELDEIIRIEVFAVVDEETFEPNSKSFRVSWDGNTDAPAPKHNTMDLKLDDAGMTKLGTIELDLSKYEYDDGDRIEFSTDELRDFLSFAYGITSAHYLSPKFRTPLQKLRHCTFILKQESGPSGVFFYSSDSFGEDADKEQSGDEQKEKDEQKKKVDINGNVSAENEKSDVAKATSSEKEAAAEDAAKDAQAKIPQAPAPSQTAIAAVPQNVTEAPSAQAQQTAKATSVPLPPPRAAGSTAKIPALEAFAREQAERKKEEDMKKSEIKAEETKGNQIDNEDSKADLRPRINFEFRREVPM